MRRIWTRNISSRRRRGMGLVDIIVAGIIMSILFAYAAKTFFYQKKSVSYTERIDNLRTLRMIMAKVTRDLETATEVVKPAYGTASYELVFRDDKYEKVRYMLIDKDKNVLLNEASLPEDLDKVTHLVWERESEDPPRWHKVARQCKRLHYVRFCRLGRNMVGIVVKLKRKEDEEPGVVRTLRLDSIVTLTSMVN